MSSYELLELLEFMPERGAFKTAARGEEFSREEKIWTQIANEIAVMRAAYVKGVKGEDYGSTIFYSPVMLREMADKAEAQTEVREGFYSFASRDSAVAKRNTPDDDGETVGFDDAEFDDVEVG